MSTSQTNWTNASTSKIEILEGLKNALLTGKNAWIEIRNNIYGEGKEGCKFPLTTKNSGLNNPFNWTMAYGTIFSKDYPSKFHNDTEKDLHLNWTVLFSTKEAREIYIKEGRVIEGLNNGMGVCTPVKIADADKTRKDGYKHSPRTIVWKALDSAYRVPDGSIKKVFVVVTEGSLEGYEDEILDKIGNATVFLKNNKLENGN
ncbi:hypothetical protein Phi4:1_gp138 [Cellulophaga phage phi4:1]|uniref:Uncharacterized protein n=5 Tax=Lightbulbvirus TaxID=1918522 RepID=A0A0S2MWP5_9CAUD|nr:hypothetical protein Phi4:1_gp138 [Cellulophaga phage phi4:1]YP_008241637.1 hypothetical protein Phi17:2_gp142 [Cellulophaga phage phi17:2]ALO80147.1 hypothetical protein Phi4113_138 [Cellulophaga phage phi4:1_13]ALO80344.1 hypothetical protein Phi4118_138 [Cellulophaga phage phi4:1_18]ALO80545.1 hypothetical protein Phi17218_142 [Cellulophaga phage phi17:2_18]AGO47675.1 hypothetical protein Phi17:2_gp142 [Cellulophaga phage phi17:2]AGO49551.1 hypothetical protein Phi4:1_gp138 [Cellulophag